MGKKSKSGNPILQSFGADLYGECRVESHDLLFVEDDGGPAAGTIGAVGAHVVARSVEADCRVVVCRKHLGFGVWGLGFRV